MQRMKAASLPDRGVVKVAGDAARNFLHGLVTADMLALKPGTARFCALLTPQGKIIADFIATEAPAADGGGFFLDVPRALATTLVDRLNLYKLRAKVLIEDLSEVLGVVAAWDGATVGRPPPGKFGLRYADPRLPGLWPRRRRPSLALCLSRPAITRRIGLRLACRAAALISPMATPFRTRPTWTSSAASISRRAATSARKSCRA